jgi:hypothetical protein
MNPHTNNAAPELLTRWQQHFFALLQLDPAALAQANGRFELMDIKALNSMRIYARDKMRPATQREVGNADNYDPLRATQAVLIVKFKAQFAPEYHVMNGNNRVHIFGSSTTNPNNRSLPVFIFDSPESFEQLLGADAWSGMPNAKVFNFEHA